ncbi:hypothetical protein FQV26_09190 [Planococcus sp. CPCC 101016]|uniref:hypothetical protein n=1 Tax=Planococcus sp. CPCC 101016 TaxID=2599617 RepID=UPI0011B5787C|nr:hypothetical protein [Planococcus sp. CPCC 101016]TWT07965.1 hypothetical protein FQV26_09190 [Planococcus sp. CPCC 101016]
MRLILGIIAIAATYLNLFRYATGKDYKWAMAMGLSFTALTVVADYSMVADWVKVEDWPALLDVVPKMAAALWVLTILSILLNTAPLLLELKSKTDD